MKLLQSNVFLVIGSFILGGISSYVISDYIRLRKESNTVNLAVTKKKSFDGRPSQSQKRQDKIDPFSQMDKIHDRMLKQMDQAFGGGRLFSNSFFDSSNLGDMKSDGIKVEEHEDDDFKYIEVIADGIDKDSLNIKISNGIISISGEIRNMDNNQGYGRRSMSSFVSSFHQSFNVPSGVNEQKVKIDTKDNKIIIKFPWDKV